MAESHDDHGHSVAAWTAVATIIVAAVLIAIGVAWGLPAFWIPGIVLVVLGMAAGKILAMAGFGSEPIAAPPAPQHGPSDDDGPRSTPQTASN
ncbi:HGxxPAAW family protein [Leekyejoonella antrihumi]|uniref:Uncharacterized protein n=1 Tax=Leekyejoonella antrihumi TaxID=1660198 RepID=A0A563DUI0_9MICO|nr:HGxxPAAW family protein [Leekyejoonella antrihumi]TWP33572.1 hypothetical protein FGL98_20760 [Leekyejoonella antrihumi]